MQSPIDSHNKTHQLQSLEQNYKSALQIFAQFQGHAAAAASATPYVTWSAAPLSKNGRTFELSFAGMTLVAVLSMRPWQDSNGVVTFYRIKGDVDPLEVQFMDSFDFDLNNADTGLVDVNSAGHLFITIAAHTRMILAVIVHDAWLKP